MMSGIQDINNSLETLYQLPAKKRLDFIIDHPSPLELVRATKTQDLLLIIREVGAESALELVEMMHQEQIQELFDLEIWSNDELNPQAAAHYISLIFEANPQTAVEKIYHLDIELLGIMLKMTATIYDIASGEEPYEYGELISTSPDNRFLVCFNEQEEMRGLSQILHTFLEQLYGHDLKFALRLLESVRFEFGALLEEESLRWRTNRLLDLGILPQQERLEFFSSVSMDELKKIMSQRNSLEKHEHGLMPVTIVAKSVDSNHPFLKAALAQSSDSTIERFWHSSLHAVTNMHASLSGDFGDKEAIADTADYVKFLIDAGIFQCCHGKVDEAIRAIEKYPTKFLIRLGRTMLTNLRKRVFTKLNNENYLFGKDFCHVDSPLREMAQALSLPEPRFYEGLLSSKKLTVKFFRTLSELNATVAGVNEMIFRAKLAGFLSMNRHLTTTSNQLSHSNLLARSLVNGFYKNANLLDDVNEDQMQKIFNEKNFVQNFTDFAESFAKDLADRITCHDIGYKQSTHDKIRNFKNAVLIQLTQNWRLATG